MFEVKLGIVRFEGDKKLASKVCENIMLLAVDDITQQAI